MGLGYDCLKLGGIEHGHDSCLNRIVEMMAQSNFIAAKFLCLVVQVPSSHTGTQIAGAMALMFCYGKDIGFKDSQRQSQGSRILFYFLPVHFVIAGIHHQIHAFKVLQMILLIHLHQLCHTHGIFAAGNTYGNPVAILNQFILSYGNLELGPQLSPVSCRHAVFDCLCPCHFFHIHLQKQKPQLPAVSYMGRL